MNAPPPEHHTAIIVGGGPAGLALAVVLGGWHPHFRESPILRQRYPQLGDYLRRARGTLLGMDFHGLAPQLPPVDLFRILHHPRQLFENLEQIAMEFRRGPALDYLLITQEEVGGLWNKVPQNLLTLSPGQWMELAFYPLAQHVEERSVDLDVNDLILKRHLVDYYRAIPERFGQESRIRTNERVERIEPHEKGFLLTTRDVAGCRPWAPGRPRCRSRSRIPGTASSAATPAATSSTPPDSAASCGVSGSRGKSCPACTATTTGRRISRGSGCS